MGKNFENLWTVLSKLESLVARNPNLPLVYSQHLAEGYDSLRLLEKLTSSLNGPLRVLGEPNDGKMYTVFDNTGRVIAYVHHPETAQTLSELSTF